MDNLMTLGQIDVAEDFLLAKVSRRRRSLSNYRRMLRLNERLLLPKVKEWLNWSIEQIRPGLGKMRGRTPTDKTKSIADWDRINAEGVVMLKPALFDILTAGGNSVIKKRILRKRDSPPFIEKRRKGGNILKQERFDPIGVEAIAWANKHSAELVVEITDKTMEAIRAYIADGVNAGKSVPTIARELRPLVGLTSKDMKAVANFHEMLILDRPEYTAARQRAMAETYARRLHRRRATTIARTETAYSLTEGQRQGYGQMGVKKLERVEDPDCCDICAENNGRIYTLAEADGILPEHPNCEGTWVAAA